jgi:hypothetical protein
VAGRTLNLSHLENENIVLSYITTYSLNMFPTRYRGYLFIGRIQDANFTNNPTIIQNLTPQQSDFIYLGEWD